MLPTLIEFRNERNRRFTICRPKAALVCDLIVQVVNCFGRMRRQITGVGDVHVVSTPGADSEKRGDPVLTVEHAILSRFLRCGGNRRRSPVAWSVRADGSWLGCSSPPRSGSRRFRATEPDPVSVCRTARHATVSCGARTAVPEKSLKCPRGAATPVHAAAISDAGRF